MDTNRGLAPGEQPHAEAEVRYNVPISELKRGDSIGTKGGSIFWLVTEIVDDRGPIYARTSNQLTGRQHRGREFTGLAPVALIR